MRTAAALVFCMAVAATAPLQSSGFPQRTMMFSGYFGRPVPAEYYPRTYGRPGLVTRGYEPQGAMSAFAAGNTVAAGSGFYGGADGNGNVNANGNGYSNGNGVAAAPDCSQCNGGVPPPGVSAEQPEADPEPQPQPQPQPEPLPAPGSQEQPGVSQEQPAEADDSDFPRDQPATATPVTPPAPAEAPQQESDRDFSHKPKPASKPGRKRPVQDSAEDDDDEEEEDFPLAGLPLPGKRRKGQGNFYSSYFPMFFGGFPGGRSSGGEGAPGVATAIANSFSTGKGAVANSHAIAYGGPHLLGATGSNGYRKNGSKARLTSRA